MKIAGVAFGALVGAALGFGLILGVAMRIESDSNNSVGLPVICFATAGGALIGGILASNTMRRKV